MGVCTTVGVLLDMSYTIQTALYSWSMPANATLCLEAQCATVRSASIDLL